MSASMAEVLTAVLEEVWDDGNCTGLDGWIGPGRGSAEVDDDAMHARARVIQKAEAALAAAGYGTAVEEWAIFRATDPTEASAFDSHVFPSRVRAENAIGNWYIDGPEWLEARSREVTKYRRPE